MKRLRQFDFLAPPTRPWAGYALLVLAGATLLCLGWLIWATRAPEALSPVPRLADSTAMRNPPPTPMAAQATLASKSVTAPAAAASAAAGMPLIGLPVEAAVPAPPASGAADTTVVAAVAQGAALQPITVNPAALREQYQLRQTRAIGGPLALPWAELLIVVQNQLRSGITVQRLEPETTNPVPPLLVRMTALASDEARMRAFIDALRSDARLHDVTLIQPVVEDTDSTNRRTAVPGVRFGLLLGWRGTGETARRAGSNTPPPPAARP
jgi:hypothetical protein